jgi:hypothetical protein
LAPLVGAIRKLSPRERNRVIEAAELIESLTKTVAKAR